MFSFDLFSSNEDSDSGLEISDLMTALVAIFILAYAAIKQGEFNLEKDRKNGMDSIIEAGFPAIKKSKYFTHIEGGIITAKGFFEHSSTQLSYNEKLMLQPLCSQIIDVVAKYANSVKYVMFKGHASSTSVEEQKHRKYFLNQVYSEQRASNAMEFCLGGDFDQKHPNLLGKFLSVGFSYSQPLTNNQDSSARRVEIEFVPYD